MTEAAGPSEMSIQEALQILHDAVDRVYQAGFIPDGEFHLGRPYTRGIVELHCVASIVPGQPVGRLTVQTLPPEGSSYPVHNSPLPSLSAKASAPLGHALDSSPDRTPQTPRNGPLPLPVGFGYTGNVCTCGSHRMVRMGTCEYCQDCGASNGCS